MPKKVLIIDPSTAVRALAATALKSTGADVSTCGADERSIRSKVKSIGPDVILMAFEVDAPDPFDFCSDLKATRGETLHFVLLSPAEHAKTVAPKAKKAGVDEVLYKPFKTEQLRRLLGPLLEGGDTVRFNGQPFGICTGDALAKAVIQRVLEKRGASLHELESLPTDKAKSSSEQKYSAIICDLSRVEDISWYSPSVYGPLIILRGNSGEGDEEVAAKLIPSTAKTIESPMAFAKLAHVFDPIISPKLGSDDHLEPLAINEQTLLAARASAAFFKLLVSGEALKQRRWEESAELVKEEALKIFQSHASGA